MELIIALIAGIAALLFWGLGDFFAKISVSKVDPYLAIMYVQVFGFLMLMAIFVVSLMIGFVPTFSLADHNLPRLFFIALIEISGYGLFYKALQVGNVSVITPIIASYAGGAVLVSIVFFSEILTSASILVLTLIILGIVLTSFEKKGKGKGRKGIVEAITAMILFSFWFPMWDSYVSTHDWLPSLLILRFFMSITVLIFILFVKKAPLKISIKNSSVLALIGLLDLAAYIAVSLGYAYSTLTSIVSVLSAVFPVVTLILAYFFLNERLKKIQLFGIVLILLGISLISTL